MRIKEVRDIPGLEDRILQAIDDSGVGHRAVYEALKVSKQFFYRSLKPDGVLSLEQIRRIEEVTGVRLVKRGDERDD